MRLCETAHPRVRVPPGAVLRSRVTVATLMMQTRRHRFPLGAALLLLFPAVPALAQDPYRQSVVVTAATTPVTLADVHRTMTVLTRAEIAALPVASVADVLRLVSSVDVKARGPQGVQSDFSVRGAGFGQMLVLVDGVRLNDAQSGHHNGDIPVPLDAVERIEIVPGPASSLFGADAFGGTVNVITRRAAAPARLAVRAGSFGGAGVAARVATERGGASHVVGGEFDRSSGFMYDRDFSLASVQARSTVGGTGVMVALQRKEFGAHNFYGGNAPSREWTNQALLAARHDGRAGDWAVGVDASYRTHGDRFVFNQELPALSDNRHRTHAVTGRLTLSRPVAAATLAVGAESGGDWIRSSNLGDHAVGRGAVFAEWRHPLPRGVTLAAGLRADRYSEFGSSWNPSLGLSWWAVPSLRVRGSVGRAFRVPTFTERYYSDPANLARADVQPEHAWSSEGGVDVIAGRGLLVQATLFRRDDRDVIDWLRASAAERWQTFNVRDVTTDGVDVSARQSLAGGGFLMVSATALRVDAPAVTQQSKYVLDYTRLSLAAAAMLPMPGGVRAGPRVEYRQRRRPGAPEDYVLLDLRLVKRLGPLLEVLADGSNLFDRRYHEVAGVRMPGAALMISLAVGR